MNSRGVASAVVVAASLLVAPSARATPPSPGASALARFERRVAGARTIAAHVLIDERRGRDVQAVVEETEERPPGWTRCSYARGTTRTSITWRGGATVVVRAHVRGRPIARVVPRTSEVLTDLYGRPCDASSIGGIARRWRAARGLGLFRSGDSTLVLTGAFTASHSPFSREVLRLDAVTALPRSLEGFRRGVRVLTERYAEVRLVPHASRQDVGRRGA